MIHLGDSLWIGNSFSAYSLTDGWSALNVAHDLHFKLGWEDGIEYRQVGLVDGPGNSVIAYSSAVLTLLDMCRRAEAATEPRPLLIFDHDGGRALAVVVMYLSVKWGPQRGWEGWLELLSERVEGQLPTPHAAHRAAYGKIPWAQLTEVVSR